MSHATLSFGDTETSKLGGMRWLSAAMIGLGGPMLAGILFFPGMAESAKIATITGLGLLAVAAASIYTISVLIPGDVMGIEVDTAADTVDLIHQGAFATVRRSYERVDVRDVRLTKAYDRDGYGFEAPELVLEDGRVFALPASVTAQDIASLRKSIGLPAAKH
jgi:hypothetical protein